MWGGKICSYHPEMPPAIVRCERDEAFIKTLDEQLTAFVEKLAEKRKELTERGIIVPKKPVVQTVEADTEKPLNVWGCDFSKEYK